MPNQLALNGAQPPRPSRRAPLYNARFSTGLWTNRSPLRDAASTRLEEKFYGARGDGLLGGENVESTQRLTLARRPGSSVYNSQTWDSPNCFYEFRQFNANQEKIKVMVDQSDALYDGTGPTTKIPIWQKLTGSGQSFMQSVGNTLYWGDGVSAKKWITTLFSRIPYSQVAFPSAQNPYNFTPYELDTFIVDSNGNVQQLIGSFLQLNSFYILSNTIVFSLKTTLNGYSLPKVYEILEPGEQIYFPAGSQLTSLLSVSTGLTLTVENLVGGILTSSVYFGGSGYTVGNIINVNQTSPQGSMSGQVQVATTGTASGSGYTTATGVPTTTSGNGTGLTLDINATSGGLTSSVTVVSGGVNYSEGDFIFPTQLNATGGYYTVTSASGGIVSTVAIATGVVKTVTTHTVGTGYYTAENVDTTGGSGTGLTLNITDDETEFSCYYVYEGGPVTTATVDNPGTGYTLNDIIYPLEVEQSGTGAELEVSFISGTVSGIPSAPVYGGPAFIGYTAGGTTNTSSGPGTGVGITITGASGGQITTVSVGAAGTGYSLGDLIYLTQGSATGAFVAVNSVSGTTVLGVSLGYPGHTAYTTATGVNTTTSGHGSGATINITSVNGSGQITAGTIDAGGTGYIVGDILYVIQSSYANTAYFLVSAVAGGGTGPVSQLTVVLPGQGYITQTGVPTSGGTGTGLTVNLAISDYSYSPLITATDTPAIYSGGNPISDARTNTQFASQWNKTLNGKTYDGSAVWINRGVSIDNGIVYNWGLGGGTNAPSVVVNNAIGEWAANTYYTRWQIIVVTVGSDKYIQQLQTTGVSGNSAPAWSSVTGQITQDNTAQWKCLGNDGDTSLTWAENEIYSPGHIIEASSSVFQLQPYAGILTSGSNFPAYCWQCNNQYGSDVGAAGEFNNGGTNSPMAGDGAQPISSATYVGTMDSLFLTSGAGNVASPTILGDGTVNSSATTLFPASENLDIGMLPEFVIPAPGTYTFTIGHQVAMFWGIGNGSLSFPVTGVSVQNDLLTITSSQNLDQILTAGSGVNLTFSNMTNATFLNGVTISLESVSGYILTASLQHANYGPGTEPSATASTGSTLTPTVVSGPLNWINSGIPNSYNFSTGTPLKGYPIMSANYPNQGTTLIQDTVQISFPSAGTYPAEIHYGIWYHTTSGYSAPTTSPVLPGTPFSFYMVYSKPGDTTNYNIIPQAIACSSSTTAPTFPAWPSTVADLQALAPNYPSVTELSGNYVWNNLGPTTQFAWNADTNYTTDTFIIDSNSNQQLPYEPGISGSSAPAFLDTLYGLVTDQAISSSTGLIWMDDGLAGSFSAGTLSTTQGGWMYVIAVVNTLDDTVSNASPPSVVTGNFEDATGVFISGGLPAVIDPQADYVAIFRTDDGGATYFLVPGPPSGNGNTEYTLPLSVYETQGFTDTNLDSALNTLIQAPILDQNNLPPTGIINVTYSLGSLVGSVANVVYWSTGPSTPVGNGLNGFSPNNYAELPSLVVRIVPLNAGWVVFTVSDIYLFTGNNTSASPITPEPFLQRIGLLSYNALTVNGSVLYFMTTDQQVLELNVHSGVSQIGAPVADQFLLPGWSPSNSYLTWHVNGNNDQCLFVADGSTGWFRLSPTAAPESGLTWSVKANIVGGCKAVQSVETTPGNVQLLIGPSASGPILYRDYNTNSDDGEAYPSNFVLGSLVLAQPGQLAGVEFITTDSIKNPITINGSTRRGLPTGLGVLLGEISGDFEDLYLWTNDPPQLFPSESLFAQRFYMSQTKQSVECRHMQCYVDFGEVDYPSEILSLTIFGGFSAEG